MALRTDRGKAETVRAAVVGCSGRYRRLRQLEDSLSGAEVSEDLSQRIDEAVKRLEIEFPARMGYSAEYLRVCAGVELARTIESAFRSAS